MHIADRLFHQFIPAQTLLQRAYDADRGTTHQLDFLKVLDELEEVDPEAIREVYTAFKPSLKGRELPSNGAFNFVLRRTAHLLAEESNVHELPHFLKQFGLE
jgi:hypothetical protein